nr:hypothetical protein [Cylindrospermum stagnale]
MAQICGFGGEAISVIADVTNFQQVKRIIADKAVAEYERLSRLTLRRFGVLSRILIVSL